MGRHAGWFLAFCLSAAVAQMAVAAPEVGKGPEASKAQKPSAPAKPPSEKKDSKDASDKSAAEKGWLGVEVRNLTPEDDPGGAGAPPAQGVKVVRIIEGSPAEELLATGDLLLSVDGKDIDSARALFALVGAKAPGKEIKLGVLGRGGKKRMTSLKLGVRPSDRAASGAGSQPSGAPPVREAAGSEPARGGASPAAARPGEVKSVVPGAALLAAEAKPAHDAPHAEEKQAEAPLAEPSPAERPLPPPPAESAAADPAPVVAEAPAPALPPAPAVVRVASNEAESPRPGLQQSSLPEEPNPGSADPDGREGDAPGLKDGLKDGDKAAVGKSPEHTFRDCAVCPTMVVVPAGSFMMGSPKTELGDKSSGTLEHNTQEDPQHSVTIPAPFAVGRYSVTFEEWDACVADGGCGEYTPDDKGWGRGRRPVINVSWADARAYVKWLSQKTGKDYRLLSEAEREYVTRAGSTSVYWWGAAVTTAQANFSYDVNAGGTYKFEGESDGQFRDQTLPVEALQANPWGLHHVHGNVVEWVEDCRHDSYRQKPEELKRTGGPWKVGDCFYRMKRGGAYDSLRHYLRSASRTYGEFDSRDMNTGFRVARSLAP